MSSEPDQSSDSSSTRIKRPTVLLIALAVCLAAALAALGVFLERSVSLSSQVEEQTQQIDALQQELTATSSDVEEQRQQIDALRQGLAATLSDPWSGYSENSYIAAVAGAALEPNDPVYDVFPTPELIDAKLQIMSQLPGCPQEIQQAQDDYFVALIDLRLAANALFEKEEWSNAMADALFEAEQQAWKAWQIWQSTIQRFVTPPADQ